jgi:hypothetical protein
MRCETDFDLPLGSKYVWMYLYSSVTNVYEIWHKYDFGNSNENIYQTFYNPKENKNASLSEFLKQLIIGQYTSATFQCASYYDKLNPTNVICLIAESKNITIIRGFSSFILIFHFFIYLL